MTHRQTCYWESRLKRKLWSVS